LLILNLNYYAIKCSLLFSFSEGIKMNISKKMLPYLLPCILAFYFLPMISGIALFLMLFALPTVCFCSSFTYSMKNNFNFTFSLLIALIFLPTVFLFYNETALAYNTFIFFIVSLLRNGLGVPLYKINIRNKRIAYVIMLLCMLLTVILTVMSVFHI